jgi:hypothetical protein
MNMHAINIYQIITANDNFIMHSGKKKRSTGEIMLLVLPKCTFTVQTYLFYPNPIWWDLITRIKPPGLRIQSLHKK